MWQTLARKIEARWYAPRPYAALMPLALVFRAIVSTRRGLYTRGVLSPRRAGRPVLVVGNITVGGSGKTPLVIALVARLAERGLKAGVVARGYGGQAAHYPLRVEATSDPRQTGDEPVLIAQRTGAPVVVAPDRVAAARALCEAHPEVDILLADDGLQHYRLARDGEIAVRDATRGYGNGWMLPAGPLREPVSRLRAVDIEAVHGDSADYRLTLDGAYRLCDGQTAALSDFADGPVHAVAGIGDPARFFSALEAAGLTLDRHPMPDHHAYQPHDLTFADDRPVLMTEKDAIKCRGMQDPRLWAVPARAKLAAGFAARVDGLIDRLLEHSPEKRR